ncbi:MAG: oligosaccharide flippase family protein [Kordiimonadaceae bacterium]|nr:oligosaccharide flippase family protein [Kordiimonadaceae bacterium]MBT6036479.1 oligosaccharide flippase family protein [Kordiimonadaceae bacterium]MBT6329374.1 oligosaccharide flippase family protein [Kordiimonadaceae bacterium]
MNKKLKSSSVGYRLKFLAKDAFFYGGLAALGRFSSILTFPFLTRLLSKETFGVLDLFLVVEMLFVFLSIMGQDSALARYFYDDEDINARKAICTSSLLVQLTLGLFVIGGLLYFRSEIMAIYGVPPIYEPLMWILALKIFLTIPLNYSINLMKWSYERNGFAYLTLGSSTCIIFAALIGAYFFENPLMSILVLQCCALLLFAVFGLFLCRGWFGRIATAPIIRALFTFGIPYGIISLSANLVPSVDRSMISQSLGIEAIAIYAVANRVANLFRVGTTAFQTAWGPFYMSTYKTDDAQDSFDLILRSYCVFGAVLFIIFSACANWFVPLLAGEQYSEAAGLSIFLAYGIIIQGAGWITGIGSFIAKKPVYDLSSYLVQLITTFIGIYLLLPIYGLMGAAISIVLGYLSQAISMTALGYYSYSLRFSLVRPFLAMLLGLLFTLGQSLVIDIFNSFLFYLFMFISIIFILFIGSSAQERKYLLARLRS